MVATATPQRVGKRTQLRRLVSAPSAIIAIVFGGSNPTALCCSAWASRRVFGSADHFEADPTSDRAGAARD